MKSNAKKLTMHDEWSVIEPYRRGGRHDGVDKEVFAVRTSVIDKGANRGRKIFISMDEYCLEILKIEGKPRVQVMTNKNNPAIIKIKKLLPGAAGFSLYRYSGRFYYLTLSEKNNEGLVNSVKKVGMHWVYFEKVADGIIVDVSRPIS